MVTTDVLTFQIDKLEESEAARQEEKKEAENKPVVMGESESMRIFLSSVH
jgi:hypothetical protein